MNTNFISANVRYEYDFFKAENSLEEVTEIKVNGKLYTMKNCEEKHGYTWRSSAGGVVLYFADENGKVFGIEREWLRKNAGRKG